MRFLDWWSGALILSGLWLNDELLTLARYCGKDCLYPIPFLGVFEQYTAEYFSWAMVIIGVLFLLYGRESTQKGRGIVPKPVVTPREDSEWVKRLNEEYGNTD